MKHILKRYSLIKDYKNRPITIILIAFIFFLSASLVLYTGGTKHSYLHIIYIPILLSAYFYKGWGGFIAGIIAGIILGPFMPINTANMAMQEAMNWSFRMFFFVLIGTIAGFLFDLLEHQLNKINRIAYFNESTNLPNKTKFRKDIEQKIEKGEEFHVIVFSIKNYPDIYKLVGSRNFTDFIQLMIEHITDYEDMGQQLYYINDSKYSMWIKKQSKKDLIKKLRKFNLHLNSPVEFKNISIFTDIIMGISTYPEDGSGFDELLEKGFLALEKVKEKKLNFWIYEKEAVEIKYNNIELLGDLNKSLEEDHFELYYQPKIDLRNKEATTFEALIRWNHPEKGFIPPGEFIPKVEKSSLIEPLTDWVISRSISDIKEYEYKEEELDVNIAINISARNFQDPNFVDNLFRHIDQFELDPSKYAIEITETDLMIEMENNIEKLYRLRSRGVQIYLDDFGKGYSSLKYLKKLPIDYIKIDKFFIEDIEKEMTKQDIVLSIIKLSHALDIEVVAEGVEKEEQLRSLQNMGCDYAQGYYFTKPDKKEKIIKWAKEFNNTTITYSELE